MGYCEIRRIAVCLHSGWAYSASIYVVSPLLGGEGERGVRMAERSKALR